MLELRMVRNRPELVREAMAKKGVTDVDLDALLELDQSWRGLLQRVEELKAERNRVSEEIAELKRQGQDAQDQLERMKDVAGEIRTLDAAVKGLEDEIQSGLLNLPSIPHDSVPVGADESENVEVRRWGEPRALGEPQAHWDLGEKLGILDFERGVKLSGSRFTVFRDAGARLVRSLVCFMIDHHVGSNGYREVWTPFMVNAASMQGTGQLPKFADDLFHIEKQGFYLIPTAEVPVTNLHRDEILEAADLPVKYVAYTPCFRSEAGAAGRDTRGLIRQHQFEKVELVKFVHPDSSYGELEQLVLDAASVLELLELPYRVTEQCTGDLGFAACKKYDLEVWMPSYGRYVEISSCSNFEDFQARRAGIRFRPQPGARPGFLHTLNGSGLAVGRSVAAILENYQRPDGRVDVPAPLVPYMGGEVIG